MLFSRAPLNYGEIPQGADPPPPPLPLLVATADKNNLNEEITPLRSGIGERYCHTISNLGHAELLRRCEPPYRRKC
jgi:hypothetical protein